MSTCSSLSAGMWPAWLAYLLKNIIYCFHEAEQIYFVWIICQVSIIVTLSTTLPQLKANVKMSTYCGLLTGISFLWNICLLAGMHGMQVESHTNVLFPSGRKVSFLWNICQVTIILAISTIVSQQKMQS